MIISDNSIIFNSTSEMKQICSPLFSTKDINYFEYVRLYNDGSAIKLDTSEEVLPYILRNDLYLKPADIPNFSPHILMSSAISNQKDNISVDVLQDYRRLFSLDHFFFLVKNNQKYIEVFVFGADKDNEGIINFYINNIDFLDQFCIYFVDKGRELIDCATKECVRFKEWRGFMDGNKAIEDSSRMVKEMHPKNVYFWLDDSNREVKISYSEYRCILSYLKGISSKVAAKELNMSNRTVENYIYRVKKKLKRTNKGQLFSIFKKNGFKV